MTPSDALRAAGKLAAAVAELAASPNPGTALNVGARLAEVMLDIMPAPVAKQVIDDAAVRRSNAIADAAEDAVVIAQKFGGDTSR